MPSKRFGLASLLSLTRSHPSAKGRFGRKPWSTGLYWLSYFGYTLLYMNACALPSPAAPSVMALLPSHRVDYAFLQNERISSLTTSNISCWLSPTISLSPKVFIPLSRRSSYAPALVATGRATLIASGDARYGYCR